MDVSSSGYYRWRERGYRVQVERDREFYRSIESEYLQSQGRYGCRRIAYALRNRGITCSIGRVARLMRLHGLRAKFRREFRTTTRSAHSLPIAENRVGRQFSVSKPNTVWAGDITYIWTSEGWLYLAVVLDLYSRKVVGWSIDARLKTSLVLQSFQAACQIRHPNKGLLFHSDRGVQYASKEFQNTLEKSGADQSMSRKGDCWDNAVVESFFKSLKVELVYRKRFQTREQARRAIFEYIEVFYNRQRLHSTLGYRSPVDFEHRQLP